MYIPSLAKIHWYLLKLSSGNKKNWMDGCTTERQTFLREVPYEVILLIFLWSSLTPQLPFLSICQPHNTIFNNDRINQTPIQKLAFQCTWRTCTCVCMDGHTDDQPETIIPCHYPVAGYKTLLFRYPRFWPLAQSSWHKHTMTACPPEYLWSKYDSFLIKGLGLGK